jgi:transposase InsO family protein
VVAFINDHREAYGVESICRVVPIAPSTYYRHRGRQLDATRRSARTVRDEVLKAIIQRLWREHDQANGFRKVWKQMGREGRREARCRVRRLMRELGLVGVVRGRAWTTTTQPDAAAARPADLVDRHFVATRPNQLGVADSRTSPRGPVSSTSPS